MQNISSPAGIAELVFVGLLQGGAFHIYQYVILIY